jgi:hypothetical protein
MANNYLQFSCSYSFNSTKDTEIFNKLVEEIQFIHDHDRNADNTDALAYLNGATIDSKQYQEIKDSFKIIDSLIDEDSCNEFGFDMKMGYDDNNPYAWVWFCAREYGNVGNLGELMQEFFIRANSDDVFTMTWSETCAKMRQDEFSGGYMTVTKDRLSMMSSDYSSKKKSGRRMVSSFINNPKLSIDINDFSEEETKLWMRYNINNDETVIDDLIALAKRKNNMNLLVAVLRRVDKEALELRSNLKKKRTLIASVGKFLLNHKNDSNQ